MDYLDVFNQSENDFQNITILAGVFGCATSILLWGNTEPNQLGSRVDSRLVDVSARTGYALVGAKRTDSHAQASEYYQVFIFKLTYFFSLLTS